MNVVIKDMSEFVQVWSPRVRATLRKFGIREDSLLDDLEQDVYFRMIDKKTLEVYDPDKGSFVTHIYQVIRTIALNYHRAKLHDPVSKSEHLMMYGQGDEEFLHPEVAKILVTDQPNATVVDEFLEKLYTELARVPAWKTSSRNGSTIKSLTMVCQLLHQGFKPREIASIFRVGPSSVSVWMDRIRKIAVRVREDMKIDG